MTELTELKSLYDLPGPFVTVSLDATRSTESGEREIELRWRALRERLADAPTGDVAAIEAAVLNDREPGPHGLTVVACGGAVAFTGTVSTPPAHDTATVSRLPQLLPYLAARVQYVPHLLVLADRTGADIAIGPRHGEPDDSVGSDRYPVHRTGRDVWSEWHFHNRVENTWEANARDVAAEVLRVARDSGAELVVLAGDERACSMVSSALESAGGPPVTEVPGGRAEGGSDTVLQNAVRDALLQHVWRQRREILEHLQQNLGRERFGAAGVADVVAALRQGQADTVILSDDPSSTLRAWVGPEPLDLALDRDDLVGVEDPVEERFDAALLRAVVGSGARLLITPNAHDYVADGIGALLRYEV